MTIRWVNTSLDHVGFVGSDLGAMRRTFVQLGFSPTEPRPLMRRDSASGALVPLDQWSCHLVFERGYIELSSVQASDATHHLSAYRAREPQLQILALATDALHIARDQVVSAGLRASEAQWAAREIAYGSRRGEARFHWFMLDPADSPEGLVCFVHNATPELVYQPEIQRHPIGARALTALAVVLPTRAAAESASARFARLQPRAGAAASGRLLVLDMEAAVEVFGASIRSATGAFAAIAVEVADIEAAAALLRRHDVPFDARAGAIRVPPLHAAGATLCLHAAGRVSL